MTSFEMRPSDKGGFHVLVDGVDVAEAITAVELGAYSYDRHGDATTIPALTPEVVLTARFAVTSLRMPDAAVHLDPVSQQLLVKLGWTPPKETK